MHIISWEFHYWQARNVLFLGIGDRELSVPPVSFFTFTRLYILVHVRTVKIHLILGTTNQLTAVTLS